MIADLDAAPMDTSAAAGLVSGTNVPATSKQLPVISTAKVVPNRDALSAKMQQRMFAAPATTSGRHSILLFLF